MDAAPAPGQFALLRQRRFLPFFCTQFLGAFNDNLFKFALTVLVTYRLQLAWLPPAYAGLVIGALFILPFVLFSATAGQLADRWPRHRLMRAVKALEIAIMALAAWGFAAQQVGLLLACVFLMGLHSTLFGPAKYAYLPQHLAPAELTGGNGVVEMGTFVAILLGNLAGGLLVAGPAGPAWVSGVCLAVALAGWLASWAIPAAPAGDPGLRVCWNPLTETLRNLRLAGTDPVVLRAMLGISWMWFFGAVFLSQFPAFAREVLRGDEQVASLLLVVFSLGVGAGSLLCERLSRRTVETGLVPFGALGMTAFAAELYAAVQALPGVPAGTLLGAADFAAQAAHWRVLADLAGLSFAAGLYSVPLYALVQLRSQPTHRARVIAANNILNALFMVASSVLAGAGLAAGLTVPGVFLATGLLNAAAAALLFAREPQYLRRAGALLRGHRAARELPPGR